MTATAPSESRYEENFPVDQIVVERQVRRHFDQAKLEELAESVRQHGIAQPLFLRLTDDGSCILVAGERRLRAARMVGLITVPARIKAMTEQEALLIQLTENLQREDLDPVEEAESYLAMNRDLGWTQQQIAERIGKSEAYVSERLSLLQIRIPEVMDALAAGQLSIRTVSLLRQYMPRDPAGEIGAAVVAAGLQMAQEKWPANGATEHLAAALLNHTKTLSVGADGPKFPFFGCLKCPHRQRIHSDSPIGREDRCFNPPCWEEKQAAAIGAAAAPATTAPKPSAPAAPPKAATAAAAPARASATPAPSTAKQAPAQAARTAPATHPAATPAPAATAAPAAPAPIPAAVPVEAAQAQPPAPVQQDETWQPDLPFVSVAREEGENAPTAASVSGAGDVRPAPSLSAAEVAALAVQIHDLARKVTSESVPQQYELLARLGFDGADELDRWLGGGQLLPAAALPLKGFQASVVEIAAARAAGQSLAEFARVKMAPPVQISAWQKNVASDLHQLADKHVGDLEMEWAEGPVYDREAFLSLQHLLSYWRARDEVLGQHFAKSHMQLGRVSVWVPLPNILLKGSEFALGAGAIQLADTGLTVSCAGGRLRTVAPEHPVYYRVQVIDRGENQYQVQQLVGLISTGARALIAGHDMRSVKLDLLPRWWELMHALPAFPDPS